MNDFMDKIKKRLFYIKIGSAIILTPMILGMILNIPTGKYTIGDESSWVGFFGNYSGGIIGAFVALIIARNELENLRENEERKRLINQLHGLVRVKFELRKIVRNLKMLDDIRSRYKEDRGSSFSNHEFDVIKHELDSLNEGNWNALNIDNTELELNLFDLKDFYENFQRVLSIDRNNLKIKIKELELEKEILNVQQLAPWDWVVKESRIDNSIMDIKFEIEQMDNEKEMQWDTFRERNYYQLSVSFLETVEQEINTIKKIKKQIT
ncbi:hypothetical protein NCCP2222_02000 [Sporosarcina sp. NCCP-2222]|uniref:hypothetical protein n=1 Tax=Sporosarcina sp. NCCP-2222 TaxID=2935073 RepID=UPI0020816856|nr:hypothetical protein [Sporosarcina sp. NCCP-2222]GKV54253.1 hypothetical protein NCCP2222_02000 [Sporosarcina sp. NCCP-2222]